MNVSYCKTASWQTVYVYCLSIYVYILSINSSFSVFLTLSMVLSVFLHPLLNFGISCIPHFRLLSKYYSSQETRSKGWWNWKSKNMLPEEDILFECCITILRTWVDFLYKIGGVRGRGKMNAEGRRLLIWPDPAWWTAIVNTDKDICLCCNGWWSLDLPFLTRAGFISSISNVSYCINLSDQHNDFVINLKISEKFPITALMFTI